MLKKNSTEKIKRNNIIRNLTKDRKDISAKGMYKWPKKKKKHMKITLIRHYKEAQIKTIMRHHYTPIRMANKK